MPLPSLPPAHPCTHRTPNNTFQQTGGPPRLPSPPPPPPPSPLESLHPKVHLLWAHIRLPRPSFPTATSYPPSPLDGALPQRPPCFVAAIPYLPRSNSMWRDARVIPDDPGNPRLRAVYLSLAEYVGKRSMEKRCLLWKSKTNAMLKLTIDTGGGTQYTPLPKGEILTRRAGLLENDVYLKRSREPFVWKARKGRSLIYLGAA